MFGNRYTTKEKQRQNKCLLIFCKGDKNND